MLTNLQISQENNKAFSDYIVPAGVAYELIPGVKDMFNITENDFTNILFLAHVIQNTKEV